MGNNILRSSDEYTSTKLIKAKNLEDEKQLILDNEASDDQDKLRLEVIGIFAITFILYYIVNNYNSLTF
jgi:hypothetical protein